MYTSVLSSCALSKPTSFLPVEFFGAVGDNITNDRESIQNGIDYCATRGLKLLLDDNKTYLCVMQSGVTTPYQAYCLNIPSGTKMYSRSGQSTIRFLPPKVAGDYSLKTSNFAGGVAVDPSNVCGLLIDQATKKNNIDIRGIHFTTDLVKWFNASNFLTTIPVGIYSANTNVENDALDASKDSKNWRFTDCKFSNFKRGTISAKGRAVDGVYITNCEFTEISSMELQYPSEDEFLYVEVSVNGLAPNVVTYDFAVNDLYDVGVYLYDSSDELIGMIPYSHAYDDPGLGQITNNIRTDNGVVNWTLGNLSAQVDHVNLYGVRRSTATQNTSLNGESFDGFAPCRNLNITGCSFNNSMLDQPDHYIYISRLVEGGSISNNTFIGRPFKYHIGGGVHIRGGAYSNMTISNNTFLNAKTNCIHISSFDNFTISNNTITYDKNMSLGYPGSSFMIIGYGDGATFSGNEINCTNKVFSGGVSSYGGIDTKNITFDDNTFTQISNVSLVGEGIDFTNNTVSSHVNSTSGFLTGQHNNVSDVLNINFTGNTFTLASPTTETPIFEGFTGFTWSNNSIPSNTNTFRLGGTLKLNGVDINNSTIPVYRVHSDAISLTNVMGTISYLDQSSYNNLVTNGSISCTNVRRSTQTVPIYNVSNVSLTGLDDTSFTISSSQLGVNLEWVDIRVLNNTNGFSYTVTNSGAFAITILDRANATNVNKNFENGGINKTIAVGGSVVLLFDKTNNIWTV